MPMDNEQKVVVVGLGYIGLPTAAVIARAGAHVLGLDVNQSVVDTVNEGRVHIEPRRSGEERLDDLYAAAHALRLFA